MYQEVTLKEPMDQVMVKTPIGNLVISWDTFGSTEGEGWNTFYITPPPDQEIVLPGPNLRGDNTIRLRQELATYNDPRR